MKTKQVLLLNAGTKVSITKKLKELMYTKYNKLQRYTAKWHPFLETNHTVLDIYPPQCSPDQHTN